MTKCGLFADRMFISAGKSRDSHERVTPRFYKSPANKALFEGEVTLAVLLTKLAISRRACRLHLIIGCTNEHGKSC